MTRPPDLARSPDRDSLLARPDRDDFAQLAPDFGRRFLLVVDTEEEFDWLAPFSRANRSVTALGGMARGQAYFTQAGVRPLWVTDWPVADHPQAGAMMAQWVADGVADVGAHLHPWVNPPDLEAVNAANSFAGSLPEEWERQKLTLLRDRIAEVTGVAPIAYRAGRYGIGPNSGRILHDLGFRVDTSVRSRFDYRAQHGPDFSAMPIRPWRAGPERALLELPLSTAHCGPLAPIGDRLTPLLERKGLAAGALSRLRLLERIPLTPEDVPLSAALRAIDALIAEDARLLMFSFHSPTLEPGCGLYVKNESQLIDFYRWWDGVLDHLAVRGVTPAGLHDVLSAASRG
ncbi:polysaccharide deacetylase family protein [Sphingobium subterraneum]|uniref:WalW protein n=1 Tax=Sphingobium subterraneum TaxID=627688 RepID=A0A841IY54_9SPHN|nr:polysaccharide deacetylase family protein [Sphingobium subterraneum]MBB6123240.1 hypothetical protein [Sphingobium subterraneum]